MNDYQMEELIPIVAGLAEKYTSKESTSVTYEKARQFMEAVIYCIQQCEGSNQLAKVEKLSAKDAYAYGYEILLGKVKQAQEAYNKMVLDFDAYGNENYNDTVTKGISGFFLYYDVVFAPQETIITMDYPTIYPLNHLSGINAIEKYVEYIELEQTFLRALPKEYVIQVLTNYQANYRKQFYNMCSIILRHILQYMLIGKKLGTALLEEDYENLRNTILTSGRENLKKTLSDLLEKLVQQKYNNNLSLLGYLKGDIDDFTVELINGSAVWTFGKNTT